MCIKQQWINSTNCVRALHLSELQRCWTTKPGCQLDQRSRCISSGDGHQKNSKLIHNLILVNCCALEGEGLLKGKLLGKWSKTKHTLWEREQVALFAGWTIINYLWRTVILLLHCTCTLFRTGNCDNVNPHIRLHLGIVSTRTVTQANVHS